jgi:hypothetical protein
MQATQGKISTRGFGQLLLNLWKNSSPRNNIARNLSPYGGYSPFNAAGIGEV